MHIFINVFIIRIILWISNYRSDSSEMVHLYSQTILYSKVFSFIPVAIRFKKFPACMFATKVIAVFGASTLHMKLYGEKAS